MTYVSLGLALETILNTIVEFNAVYNYEPKELLKYPTATVTALSHEDIFSDTATNTRVFTFTIRLYYRTDLEDDAESILRDLADKVIVALEADPTLSGACDFAKPTKASWTYSEREVPVRIVEMTIDINKRVPR